MYKPVALCDLDFGITHGTSSTWHENILHKRLPFPHTPTTRFHPLPPGEVTLEAVFHI